MSLRTNCVRIVSSFKCKEGVCKTLNQHPGLSNSLEVVFIDKGVQRLATVGMVFREEYPRGRDLLNSSLIAALFDAMAIFAAPTFETLVEVTNEEYQMAVSAESIKYFERGDQMFPENFATTVDK
ncbi:hypothetical protein EDC04DRAFT_2606646 [Pisolithus marmoratus]|nr:hypothetical protein EDC04DRAFT_2606646 [Pisolithus marmoratus]